MTDALLKLSGVKLDADIYILDMLTSLGLKMTNSYLQYMAKNMWTTRHFKMTSQQGWINALRGPRGPRLAAGLPLTRIIHVSLIISPETNRSQNY